MPVCGERCRRSEPTSAPGSRRGTSSAQADPGIVLAVGLPNHPSYPSNHSCISGSMGRVLDAMVPGANGMYEQMARQAGASRICDGLHYQMHLDAGDEIARKVAARALLTAPAPRETYMPAGR